MKSALMALMITLLIMMILITVINLTSKKTFSDKEKNSPFECGFDPKTSARMPFSLQFFLIAIIFLIFDIEVALLMPIIKIMELSNALNMWTTLNIFILILASGLFHEWQQGALNWLK